LQAVTYIKFTFLPIRASIEFEAPNPAAWNYHLELLPEELTMLFLQSDLDRLRSRISELQRKKREVGEEVGESCRQGAETTHDNAPFDLAMHSLELVKGQLLPLLALERNARIVAPPKAHDRVAIGHTVTFIDLVTSETETYRIGSYWVDGEKDISYISPLAAFLLNCHVGMVKEGKVAGRPRKIRIEKIEP
jgi:transcription elongation GreA/GreB family factor